VSHLSISSIIMSIFQADATGYPDPLGSADQLPSGFFDDAQVNVHVHVRHHHLFLSITSCPDFCVLSPPQHLVHSLIAFPRSFAVLGTMK
jgi:hypothetical protein